MVEEKQEGGVFCPSAPGKIGLMYKSRNIMSLLRDMKLVSCDKSVDLTGVVIMSRDNVRMFAT